MIDIGNTKVHLNNCQGQWFYALPGDKELKPISARDFKDAVRKVKLIIEKK